MLSQPLQNNLPFLAGPNRRGQGSTAPDLVLLHGLFGQLSNFEPIFDKVDPSYNLWVPELPLYVPEEGPESIHQLAQWLVQWMSDQGIRSAIFVGNSLGGHLAAYLAATWPALVEGLVLVGSSGLYEAEFGDSVPRRFDREYIRTKAGDAFHDYKVSDGMVDGIQALITDRDKLSRVLLWARSVRKAPLHDVLPKLGLPVALIWGAQDQITPPFVAEHFKTLLPDAEMHWIEACGHVPMMEQPKAFADALNAFLSNHFSEANVFGSVSSHSYRLDP